MIRMKKKEESTVKKFFLLGALFSFLLVQPAMSMAKTVVFGPKEWQHTVELPENWLVEELENGAEFSDAEKTKALSITLFPKGEVSIQTIQQTLPSELNLIDIKKQEKKDRILISGTYEKERINIELIQKEEGIIALVHAGMETKLVQNILKTLEANSNEASDSSDK